MPSFLNELDREAMLRRLALLTPSSERRWGNFSVGAMLCHLCESARMALGELPVKSRNKRAFQTFPLKHLALYVVPFPKGAPTARELLAGQPGDFEADRTRLLALLQKLASGEKEGRDRRIPCSGRSPGKSGGRSSTSTPIITCVSSAPDPSSTSGRCSAAPQLLPAREQLRERLLPIL